jgi:hypothetical protein
MRGEQEEKGGMANSAERREREEKKGKRSEIRKKNVSSELC